MWGRIRSSQRGTHQFAEPSRLIVDGTSTIRTSVASMNTAVARPRPNILTVTSSVATKARNTLIMISAADVITLAVVARPSTTLRVAVTGPLELLTDPGQEEHLVVHREPEEDGEHDHRDERVRRAPWRRADEALAPAPLEHGDDHAVGGADRQQVHDRRLERHQHRAEHDHQQQERQRHHGRG